MLGAVALHRLKRGCTAVEDSCGALFLSGVEVHACMSSVDILYVLFMFNNTVVASDVRGLALCGCFVSRRVAC
jgi:hypothetical protein